MEIPKKKLTPTEIGYLWRLGMISTNEALKLGRYWTEVEAS